MNRREIKHVQRRIGVKPDGFWGPISTAGAAAHLRGLMNDSGASWPTQGEVRTNRSIYGRRGFHGGPHPPGERIELPFSLQLYGDAHRPVHSLYIHPVCATAYAVAFDYLADEFPTTARRRAAGILNYFGVYNPRNARGSSAASMHAYRLALDLDANNNRNRSHWPTASSMPIEVMECFAMAGILPAGAFWSRDAMHFQATIS